MLDDVVRNTVEAIAKGRTDVILTLVETYERALTQDNLQDSISLRTLLDSNVTEFGTLLHYATRLNQTDIVRALLLAGSDPSIKNEQNRSCYELCVADEMQIVYLHELMRVIALSCVSKVDKLLGSGFDVNSQKLIITRDTPLHWAATYADYNTVCFLLDKGANPNALNSNDATPFHDAVVRGEPDIIEELLRHGANPNIKPQSGKYLEKFNTRTAASENMIFQMRDEESDLEQNSDSSGSWINAGGSNDSLTVACPTEILHPLEFNKTKGAVTLMSDYGSNLESPAIQISSSIAAENIVKLKEKCKLLWPPPRNIQLLNDDEFALSKDLKIYVLESRLHNDSSGQMLRIWEEHSDLLSKAGLSLCYEGLCCSPQSILTEGIVVCYLNEEMLGGVGEAYTIQIATRQIKIVASDIKGFYYAVSFLVKYIQLFVSNMKIPAIKVCDWPKWKFRGWAIDISSSKPILKLDSIRREIDLASLFRFNNVLLHFSVPHAMNNEEVYYFTPRDFLNLEKYCNDRCITLTPSVDLFSYYNGSCDVNVIDSVRSYLRRFSGSSYVYVGPSLARYCICTNNVDLNYVLSERCLIFDTSLLDTSLSWINRVPLNSILVSNLKHLDEFSNPRLVQRRLSLSGCASNVELPCVLETSVTGCSGLLFRNIYDAAKVCHSVENVVFIMSGMTKQGKYHLPRTFYLPAMTFGGGMAWNPNLDFETDGIENLISRVLGTSVFGTSEEIGNVILELCHVESSLRTIPFVENSAVFYELISNPNNVGLDFLTIEKLQRAVRDLKLSVCKLVVGNTKDIFTKIALEEVQLVADLMLFTLRLCRHLINAGQNPNSKSSRGTGLAVINVGLSNLPPPIRTDLANKLLELMRRFRNVNLQSHISKGLEQEGQPFYCIFQQLFTNNLENNILDV